MVWDPRVETGSEGMNGGTAGRMLQGEDQSPTPTTMVGTGRVAAKAAHESEAERSSLLLSSSSSSVNHIAGSAMPVDASAGTLDASEVLGKGNGTEHRKQAENVSIKLAQGSQEQGMRREEKTSLHMQEALSNATPDREGSLPSQTLDILGHVCSSLPVEPTFSKTIQTSAVNATEPHNGAGDILAQLRSTPLRVNGTAPTRNSEVLLMNLMNNARSQGQGVVFSQQQTYTQPPRNSHQMDNDTQRTQFDALLDFMKLQRQVIEETKGLKEQDQRRRLQMSKFDQRRRSAVPRDQNSDVANGLLKRPMYIARDSWKRPRCSVSGCMGVDRGEGRCCIHGGGQRCEMDGCNKLVRIGSTCFEHCRKDWLVSAMEHIDPEGPKNLDPESLKGVNPKVAKALSSDEELTHFARLSRNVTSDEVGEALPVTFAYLEKLENRSDPRFFKRKREKKGKGLSVTSDTRTLKSLRIQPPFVLEGKKEATNALQMNYKRFFAKGIERGMYFSKVRDPRFRGHPTEENDLKYLPSNWNSLMLVPGQNKMLSSGNGTRYESLKHALSEYIPKNVVYRLLMPVQDFYWMFRDTVGSSMRKAWQQTIKEDPVDYELVVRFTDYKQIKKCIGLGACRIKLDNSRFAIAALPMVIIFRKSTSFAEVYLESKETTWYGIPNALTTLLPSRSAPAEIQHSRQKQNDPAPSHLLALQRGQRGSSSSSSSSSSAFCMPDDLAAAQQAQASATSLLSMMHDTNTSSAAAIPLLQLRRK